MKKLTLFGALILLCPFVARAQNESSQNVDESACVAQPITLTNATGLNFGRIVSGANAGHIYISATGAATSDNVTNGPAVYSGSASNTHSAATFYVTGEPGYCYSISTPATSSVSNGSQTMTVHLGTPAAQTVDGHAPSGSLNVAGTASTIAGNGYDAWGFGGTLDVSANQASGTYTGSFSEQVQYQ